MGLGQGAEEMAVLGTIDPADQGTSAKNSDFSDMERFKKITAVLLGGAITGTLDMKLQQAQDVGGTGVKDIAGKTITTIIDTNDNSQALISVDASEMDIANDFTHVRAVLTPTGGSTNFAGVVMLGTIPRYTPVDDHDLASVDSIVT